MIQKIYFYWGKNIRPKLFGNSVARKLKAPVWIKSGIHRTKLEYQKLEPGRVIAENFKTIL